MKHPPCSSHTSSSTVHTADRPLAGRGFQESLASRGAYRFDGFQSPQIRRLSMGAALLGCALACIQETSAQAARPLAYSTLSNLSITASIGGTIGSAVFAGPGTLLNTPIVMTSGSGSGMTQAYNYLGYHLDVVGFAISDSTTVGPGGASGTFTMDFTAAVIFTSIYGFNSATQWSATGIPSVSDGQLFTPGQYTFNFTTTQTTPAISYQVIAGFVAIPEGSPPGFLMAFTGVFLGLRSLRHRRIRHGRPSSDAQTG